MPQNETSNRGLISTIFAMTRNRCRIYSLAQNGSQIYPIPEIAFSPSSDVKIFATDLQCRRFPLQRQCNGPASVFQSGLELVVTRDQLIEPGNQSRCVGAVELVLTPKLSTQQVLF